MKSLLLKQIAKRSHRLQKEWDDDPIQTQQKVFKKLIKGLSKTEYGRNFGIHPKMSIEEYQAATKIMEYEDYEKAYLPGLHEGKKNILWPGQTKYICQSSGTTSGLKYIPVHRHAILAFLKASFHSSLVFMHKMRNYEIFSKKIFHLYGLSTIKMKREIRYGYIGQVANSFVPAFFVRSKYPADSHRQFASWEDKVEFLSEDLPKQDIMVMGGTPPWMNQVLQKFNQKNQSNFAKQFPALSLYIHGGCDFENYRETFFELLGTRDIFTMEVYPASEGYIGFQVDWDKENPSSKQPMSLNLGSNIFFEFLEFRNGETDQSKRLLISDLEENKIYTLMVSTAGSYLNYIIGDNIKVVSLSPFRFIFAGRSKQNVNLVNEHMDFRTIQLVFEKLNQKYSNSFEDYILIPQVKSNTAVYRWYLATNEVTFSHHEILKSLQDLSTEANSFYKQWRRANMIKEEICLVKEDSFLKFLQSKNSVGQNKVPNVILGATSQSEFQDFISPYIHP